MQAKLKIGEPNDRFEREADRVADEVVRMPESRSVKTGFPRIPGSEARMAGGSSLVQKTCSKCKEDLQAQPKSEKEEEELLQRKPAADSPQQFTSKVESNIQAGRNGGQPLSKSTRAFFEPRFGQHFDQVRIHTDSRAAESARSINARAFTTGQHIIFDEGQYAPQTATGRKLLAHELTHTVQQTSPGGVSSAKVQRTIGDGHDLVAARFSGVVELEAAFDDERLVRIPNRGNYVRLIQQSLLDMGYTLPEAGADGIFGPETKAAVERFQTDAGAVLIDGIVGPETMGLLDQRDVTNLTGLGPPAVTGPVPSPRPTVGGGCAQHFSGVTFTLANQVAAGVAPAARIAIDHIGGRDALVLEGTVPANYHPDVTINAPSNARAAEFEVGLIQNALALRRDFTFNTGATIRNTIPTPIKDGAPLSSGLYHPIFAENGGGHPGILEQFTATGATINLNLPDTPSDFAFVNLLDNAQCGAPLAAATMTRGAITDEFRTWVAVRHRPSGCVRALHHIDWNLDWSATVNGAVAPPTRAVTSNAINVTVTNGNGSPSFIQGGQVPADFFAAHTDRVCS
ncbi:DUF4157 domain-containing protein [Desulforhabdus sp. TSK]|uniref:eCIS core domain-containing protein n=1 Tax=Desulforhabdus sp. TSK TaxID=2925014 RepID=UPI001FC7D261|nr:DUF4157 domain-containing protein [Desulforhabdus sp. TSK]